MYGPFWVLTTLVAALFTSSNMYCKMAKEEEEEQSCTISVQSIPVAASIIYGVSIGVPLLIRLTLQLYGTVQAGS